ncbi:MAG: hypothetical protein ACPGNV_09945 [Mangrovicoccus sp.]
MDFVLTPGLGVVLIVAMAFCGRQFRETWKAQAQGWQWRAWVYGLVAAGSFAILAFVPLELG